MIIRKNEMRTEERDNMRGGDGKISISHLAEKEDLLYSRLLAKIQIPEGGSIGEHKHQQETEYYIILKGEAEVIDNGLSQKVGPGDLVITGDGASHSIRNCGKGMMEMIAIIITGLDK